MDRIRRKRAVMAGFGAFGVLALLCAGAAAHAKVDLAEARTCIADSIAATVSPAVCIDAAHAACHTVAPENAATAIVCFRDARAVWDGGITDALARLRASADDTRAAIGAVELKYDLIGSLTQCDRLEELAIVGSDTPPETILRDKSGCEAAAAAFAYIRLHLRAQAAE